ncbi:protein translocase subunit SecF [Rubrobacter calidifluminis]|uniref:protein translocase subunit SecF n=1 Tax=Rubrobacter calidifluminis TaxID=1392640 RepID=UPI00236121C7|nr:protein translocase subunit SecF [Rubrobacter calidifluminis]
MFERTVQRIDFVGRWKVWFAISGILLLAGLVSIGLGRLNLGIDFEGGAKFTVSGVDRHLSTGEVRGQVLPNYAAKGAVIQPTGRNGYQIQTPVLSQKQIQRVEQNLKHGLGGEVSVTSVSPTFGGQVQTQALQAVGAAFLIIVLFISFRFEFAFALAAMLALVHDLLMTIGFYAIVGREVSLITVVAVLTILGYSLYDTIIIFDRIRENTPAVGYNRRRFDQTINTSIRQVIRRSIYTSLSTVIPVAALLIFGESTLSDFAFALLVGIISGTYSSIFIASPILSLYKAWRGGKLGRAAPASSSS